MLQVRGNGINKPRSIEGHEGNYGVWGTGGQLTTEVTEYTEELKGILGELRVMGGINHEV